MKHLILFLLSLPVFGAELSMPNQAGGEIRVTHYACPFEGFPPTAQLVYSVNAEGTHTVGCWIDSERSIYTVWEDDVKVVYSVEMFSIVPDQHKDTGAHL